MIVPIQVKHWGVIRLNFRLWICHSQNYFFVEFNFFQDVRKVAIKNFGDFKLFRDVEEILGVSILLVSASLKTSVWLSGVV